MNAAKRNPKFDAIIIRATAEMRRIGLDLDEFAANPDTRKLNDAMKASSWNSEQRMRLKENLYLIGALDA